MHLLKSAVSSILLLASILWLGIQHIFLSPADVVIRFWAEKPIADHHRETADFLQLRRDWCRIRSKKISWREIVGPCQGRDYFMRDKRFATNAQLSQVSQVLVKSAGEHTLLRIDTYTNYGVIKGFGGDSFRVVFRGPEVVSATVFDLQNGSYDALAFLTTPGYYSIKVVLDYTQCNGMKDPPTEWYVQAHCATRGKNNTEIGTDISSQMSDYVNEEISPGIVIRIPSPKYDVKLLPSVLNHINCGFHCNNVWDGQGGWMHKPDDSWEWNEEIQSRDMTIQDSKPLPDGAKIQEVKPSNSTLWVYGDSISYYFFKRLEKTKLCSEVFDQCNNTYNWIYPKTLYELRHFCEDIDVNVQRITKYFKEVIHNKEMGSRSILILNLGAHFVKNTSFRKYRTILNALMSELKSFNGTVIWKSTTAIHDQNIEVMGAFRRYLTNQRVQLFNAYANSIMCSSSYHLLDIYPLTASFPYGTKDGVHYHRNASAPMEKMLINFLTNNK